MTLCRFFEMAATPSQIFFCFLVLWHVAFRKAKNYNVWSQVSNKRRVYNVNGLTDIHQKHLLLTKFSPQPTYLHNLISLQTDNNTRSSDVVTLARPSPASSLKVTHRLLFSVCLTSSLKSTSIQGCPVNVKHDARCVMGKVGGKTKDPNRGEF